jgi:hypothetical protein
MSDVSDRFPRRDDDGRVAGLPDLLALTLGYLLLTALVLAVIDGVSALFGWGTVGSSNGWFTLILPAWLFILEEFRAWRPVHGRLVLALSGGVVAVGLGLAAATFVADLPPLLSGGAGAAVASVAYALYWFHGVRWLARREGSIT